MQEIVVNNCECPFEVSAIIDIVDLIPGATYKYQLRLTNAGDAVFNPSGGEFTAKSTTETLNIIVYLKDNPNNHYLISLELSGSHSTNPADDQIAKKFRRQIICIKNTSCLTPQCTATPTLTPTPSAYKLDKHRTSSNYSVKSNEDKTYGLYRSDITIGDWVDFLNSIAQYEDTYSLWKSQMATDSDCGIQKVYDGFFYVYTVNGCSVGESQCYPNEPTHLSRKISYVSWNDLARYINWISNGKPKGKQGPDTTEDGSYPLFGNFYSTPIDYYPGSRFWLETGPPTTPTSTPTITPTPSITQSPFPVGLSISSQPAIDVFTAVGIDASVSVTAVAVPSSITLLYQWQKSTDGGANWTDISGAVSSTLIITSTQPVDSGTFYRVRVSGSSPPGVAAVNPINSNNSVLTVQNANISITSHPTNINTSGNSATFSVLATITPSIATLSYQWQKSVNSGATWSNITGATTSTLSLSSLTVADSGSMYQVIVSGTGGATTVTSLSATLVITAPTIIIDPAVGPLNTISTNASATFGVSASIPDLPLLSYILTYTWQKSINSGSTWTNIPSSNFTSLTINNITKSSNGHRYRVVVSSSTSSTPVTSNGATLTVEDNDGGLLVWGSNGNNQLNITGTFNKPNYTNKAFSIYRSVAVGASHTLMVNSSGTLETYGINTQFQTAGLGTDNIIKVVTKYNHNLAIINDSISNNRLYSWGANSAGQCGQGTSTTVTTPTAIPSDVNVYQDISTGENHSLAVTNNGVLVACGNNSFGQLGTNHTASQNVFVSIAAGYNAVACGQNHSAAIKTNGTLWTWGNNTDGQLGLGDTTSRNIPTQVTGIGFVTKVVCGQNFTAVLNTLNQLWIWGANSSSQLGNGLTANVSSPSQITGSWTDISLGNIHALAIKSDSTLWAWGGGLQSQIGDGSSITRSIPTQISSIPGWGNVYAGGTSSCAIREGAIIGITNHPVTTEAENGSVSFSVVANITNYATLSYQWQRSQDNITWNDMTTFTSNSLTITNLNQQIGGESPSLFDGYYYRCSLSGTESALSMVTLSAQLIDKRSTVYYIGNSAGNINLPSITSVWSQWNNFNYNSTSYGKSATALPVQIVQYNNSRGIAVLLSNGSVIAQGRDSGILFHLLANPFGDRIVRLISNSYSTRIYGISETGKIYGANPNPIIGFDSWLRIGSSFVTTSNAGSVAIIGGITYNQTLYAISAIDNTLWAWGDGRLMGTTSTSTYATLLTSSVTEPVLVSSDTWSYVGGSTEGFFGIKTDGSIHRLCGVWAGGTVISTNSSRFTTGTLVLNIGNSAGGRIAPILIDNTRSYTKLAATNNIIAAYDINNKLHTNKASGFHLDINLPTSWTSISDMLSDYTTSNVVIMTTNNLASTASNVARVMSNGSIIFWNIGGGTYSSVSNYNWGEQGPSNVKARFKSVTLSPAPGGNNQIVIKGD